MLASASRSANVPERRRLAAARGQPGATLKQENMLVVPASFSRLH